MTILPTSTNETFFKKSELFSFFFVRNTPPEGYYCIRDHANPLPVAGAAQLIVNVCHPLPDQRSSSTTNQIINYSLITYSDPTDSQSSYITNSTYILYPTTSPVISVIAPTTETYTAASMDNSALGMGLLIGDEWK